MDTPEVQLVRRNLIEAFECERGTIRAYSETRGTLNARGRTKHFVLEVEGAVVGDEGKSARIEYELDTEWADAFEAVAIQMTRTAETEDVEIQRKKSEAVSSLVSCHIGAVTLGDLVSLEGGGPFIEIYANGRAVRVTSKNNNLIGQLRDHLRSFRYG